MLIECDDLPKVAIISANELEPFHRAGGEVFADFEYSKPPLAEIQILRALDGHIKRKKKDQLDKARRFKEQLLQKRKQ